MNPADSTPSPAAADVTLTRQEKEKLLQSMYTLAHWITIIRLFGYQTLPMEKARQAIKPIADEHGKEPVANACEALVEIRSQDKEPTARLKPQIRRMAFQILGPEPQPDSATPSANAQPLPAPDSSSRSGKSKAKKPAKEEPSASMNEPTAKTDRRSMSSIMEQYCAAKEKHPGMMLLFRVGDFYELFGEDAETAHKLLGLTLTTRDRTVAMAGFPHHQLEAYLHKLLHAGQRVAVCEPVEESLARGPIPREVTRVVTPGHIVEEDGQSENDTPNAKPVRQPRVFVLKQYEKLLKEAGLAYVAVEDVKRTTPTVVPHVSGLDYIVLRGDDKLLVTVRPHLQVKHIVAIRELQELFGADYKSIRVWPEDGPTGWSWREDTVDPSAAKRKPNSRARNVTPSRAKQSS